MPLETYGGYSPHHCRGGSSTATSSNIMRDGVAVGRSRLTFSSQLPTDTAPEAAMATGMMNVYRNDTTTRVGVAGENRNCNCASTHSPIMHLSPYREPLHTRMDGRRSAAAHHYHSNNNTSTNIHMNNHNGSGGGNDHLRWLTFPFSYGRTTGMCSASTPMWYQASYLHNLSSTPLSFPPPRRALPTVADDTAVSGTNPSTGWSHGETDPHYSSSHRHHRHPPQWGRRRRKNTRDSDSFATNIPRGEVPTRDGHVNPYARNLDGNCAPTPHHTHVFSVPCQGFSNGWLSNTGATMHHMASNVFYHLPVYSPMWPHESPLHGTAPTTTTTTTTRTTARRASASDVPMHESMGNRSLQSMRRWRRRHETNFREEAHRVSRQQFHHHHHNNNHNHFQQQQHNPHEAEDAPHRRISIGSAGNRTRSSFPGEWMSRFGSQPRFPSFHLQTMPYFRHEFMRPHELLLPTSPPAFFNTDIGSDFASPVAPSLLLPSLRGRGSPPLMETMYELEAVLAPDVDSMSYEELLDLSERVGRVGRGVSSERLQQLHMVLQSSHFTSAQSCRQANTTKQTPTASSLPERKPETTDDGMLMCCVCLDDFSIGQNVTQLPCCHHFLHNPCAARWFQDHFRCPICTRDVR